MGKTITHNMNNNHHTNIAERPPTDALMIACATSRYVPYTYSTDTYPTATTYIEPSYGSGLWPGLCPGQ